MWGNTFNWKCSGYSLLPDESTRVTETLSEFAFASPFTVFTQCNASIQQHIFQISRFSRTYLHLIILLTLFPWKLQNLRHHEKITIWLLGKKLGFMEQWNGSLSNGNNSRSLKIRGINDVKYVPFSNGKITEWCCIHHGCAYLTYSLCTETSSKLSQDLYGLL